MNQEAAKLIGAYVGGTLAGSLGAGFAIRKIREATDPSYRAPSFLQTRPLHEVILEQANLAKYGR